MTSSVLLPLTMLLFGASTGESTRLSPSEAVVAFVQAVDAGDDRYRAIFDVREFHRRHAAQLQSCPVRKLEGMIRRLVHAPVRHAAHPDSTVAASNRFELAEEVRWNSGNAIVRCAMWKEGSRVVNATFSLVVRRGRWRIVDVDGWLEKELLAACSR